VSGLTLLLVGLVLILIAYAGFAATGVVLAVAGVITLLAR